MKKSNFNIAIDGPAGAGKSTIARAVAGKLGFVYVDTGAMYRAMALHFLRMGIRPEDEAGIGAACASADIVIRYKESPRQVSGNGKESPGLQPGGGEAGSQQVFLNGEDVSGQIRTEEVGNMASATSVYPAVRAHLLELQRSLAASTNVIMDGRDIGTCILPDADAKVFLTASTQIRAMRRFKELTEKGMMCNLEEIEQDIKERDQRDMTRAIAPLKQADDAVLVDGSEMTIDEVIAAIIRIAGERGLDVGRFSQQSAGNAAESGA